MLAPMITTSSQHAPRPLQSFQVSDGEANEVSVKLPPQSYATVAKSGMLKLSDKVVSNSVFAKPTEEGSKVGVGRGQQPLSNASSR